MQTETEKLARFVANLQFEDLPADIVKLAKHCILDIVACAIRGNADSATGAVAKGAGEAHAGRECTAWATGQRTSAAGAAMVNAICAEAEDFTYALGGTTIIPVVLAIAEKERLSGRQLLLAMVCGHEVLWRVHKAVDQFSLQQRGFYPQGVCAIFGPTAAAAKCLGLDGEQIAAALCLSAGAGIGIRAYAEEGHRTKQFYLGTAAASAITVGYLARAGMTAARSSLEGPSAGFLKVYGGSHESAPELAYELGRYFMMRRTAFKLYPSCRYVHTSVDAARELARSVRHDEVQEISVRVPSMAAQVAGERPIRTSYDCQFSIPWAVAATLVDGTGLSLEQVSAERINDSRVRDLAAKVKVIADKELDQRLHGDGLPPVVIGSRMSVKTIAGRSMSVAVDYARGSAENPASADDLKEKFNQCVAGIVDDERAARIVSLIDDLEAMNDIASLVEVLRDRDD